MDYSNQPIGELGSVTGWKQLPIHECGERLVPIGPFSMYPQIATDSIYAGECNSSPYAFGRGMLRGALLAMFVRKSVAERLAKAAALLPPQHMLLVWDAYRPLHVQRALFDYYVDVLVRHGLAHDTAMVEAQRFVSIPSDDSLKPPPHNTGGAVDLTIVHFPDSRVGRSVQRLGELVLDEEDKMHWDNVQLLTEDRQMKIRLLSVPLKMGTTFDAVAVETATRFYEEMNAESVGEEERRCLANRRLLCGVMAEVGFSNYPEEWWHFDVGNQFDAARTGRPAIYGSAELSEENRLFEKMSRIAHCAYRENGEVAEVKIDDDGSLSYRVEPCAMLPALRSDTVHPMAAAL